MEYSLGEIVWRLAGVLALVFANGFFVASEFAIVTTRRTRIDQMIAEGHRSESWRPRRSAGAPRGDRALGRQADRAVHEAVVGDLGGAVGAGERIAVRPDGSADIDGLVLVMDANEQFNLEIDEDTYTTVGGYVLGRLGRRARVGDTIEVGGRQMRVEALDALRVAKVWLSLPANRSTPPRPEPPR